jgi:phenylalanyl-tRNA synthetase alpha subunit
MKKIIAYSSILLIFFAGCALAGKAAGTKDTTKPAGMCVNYDKLTKDQKADIEKMIGETMDKVAPMKQEILANFETLHAQMMTSPIDEKAINKTAKNISDVKTSIFMMHIQTITQIDKKYGYIPMCCFAKEHCAKMMEDKYKMEEDMEKMMKEKTKK